MQISSTRNSVFFENEGEPRKGANFKVVPTDRNVFIPAPDWLLDNSYFKRCVADGSIVVVEVKSAPPTPKRIRQTAPPGIMAPNVRVNEAPPPPEPEPQKPVQRAGELPGLQQALEDEPAVETAAAPKLEDMSKNDLFALAKQRGIAVPFTAKKVEIIDMLQKTASEQAGQQE